MNIFVYGMQSSGASLITFFLGQLPRSVCVVDVWSHVCLPGFDDAQATADHVIVKCVVTTRLDVADHLQAFGPDARVLVLRHPLHNYISLVRKHYRHESGALDEKFRKLETVFQQRDAFDAVVVYEDFAFRRAHVVERLRACSIPVQPAFYAFSRTQEDIRAFNETHSAWCRDTYEQAWGFGRLKGTAVQQRKLFKYARAEERAHVRQLCPSVYAFMEAHYQEHVPALPHLLITQGYDRMLGSSRMLRRYPILRRYGKRIRALLRS